ncbi:MAG: formylmethanofuran dehydrogenase subunit C [Methylococcales bacterium]|nr:formylmethanofuran dehydrogenase subunit C [Methylococcales bacterium]MDD5753245.1 formylmethanofuran dehydrogenase subunit C [Methylococcales bacterium]
MSALTFTLKTRPDQRVDMSPLVCHALENLEPIEIAALKLQCGKRKVRVDELFAVSGYDTKHIMIKNSFSKLDYIGKNLDGGIIHVEGDVGAYCGMGLKTGVIKVFGNAGIYAGCEMKKGQLEIDGNAGDFLGGALAGNKMGMKGGLILVKGNAGDRVGDHLRRGTILIEGSVGDYCGSRMIAGTIAVMGNTGKFLGHGMRRGTLLLWNMPKLSASFNDCGSHTLAFLPMLFNSFKTLNSLFANSENAFNRVQRFAGDMAEIGRGEVLIKI